MRIALTGGIACGKSLLAKFLRELGVAVLDADDVVHELVPEDERRRLAPIVFADPVARKALEARLHPIVRERMAAFDGICSIPLLFECNWDDDYDIIICVASPREVQVSRMITTRGYSRAEAEARLAAQLPVEEKAARSDYVINNDSTSDRLRAEAKKLVEWLQTQTRG